MKIISKSIDLNGKTLTLEVGRFASLANAAVLARYGDTMVLATVVAGPERPDLGYFPLTVEYIERLYAGGRIKGSRWVKREGRPSDEAILTARLVDRSIRPLFPKEFVNEIQVMITVLSVDMENDPDVLSIIATSAALSISDIPWNGPVAGVRVGFIQPKTTGEENQLINKLTLILNPISSEMVYSDLDLVISASSEAILMVEAGAKEVPEETVLQALDFGYNEIKKIIKVISDLVSEVGKKKMPVAGREINADLLVKIEKSAREKFEFLLDLASQGKVSENSLDEIKRDVVEEFKTAEVNKTQVMEICEKVFKKITRKNIIEKGKRPDGRKADQIRPIEIQVGVLPRTHGSAMFKRGETQALTVVTLGAPSLRQYLEFATGEETKRYIHHYSMPPYSLGETGRVGFPSRREVGHGALAERALMPVIPDEDKFPYTIRVVSEIMTSNGSTSMASVCGSTLSLMDAGVPLKELVAGIAMGLIIGKSEKDYVILSDIIGFEDFFGDMDFKVAGTKNGITALQLDVKIAGLTLDIFKKAFQQAKIGRMFILDKMLAVLPEPRPQLSKYAPRVSILHIPVDAIGTLIGPGGKMIKKIIAETGATIDVEEDGSVNVTAVEPEAMKKAINWIESLTKEVKPGEIYEGIVKRIQPFGAFVEILPGKEGLVHVSQMASGFISDPEQVVKLGQKVKVRVVEIDNLGRLNLSMLFGEDAQKKPLQPKKPSFGPRRPMNDRMRRW